MSLIPLVLAGCSEGASTRLGNASRSVVATCVTIQRGVAGDIADTQIASNRPDKNQGGMPIANVGTSGGGERQALLRADLSQIPAQSRVESATLSLWQSNTGQAVVRAHQVLAAWDEGTITWNSFGGAFAPEVAAEVDNGGPGQERAIALDVTELVQAWVDGASANHGLLLAQDAGSATRIHTGKAGNASHRPRLEVCYTPASEPEGTSLFVQVLDTEGAPIASAAVRVGEALHATDGAGRLLLENLPAGRVVAQVEARGFAPASAVVDLPPGAQAGTEVRLFPLGEPVPFEAEAGAVLEEGAVRVEIPAGGLVDFRGEPVTGTVEATVVPLDPSTASLSDFPGPLEGSAAGTGEAVSLDSLAMAEVSLWQDGLPLHLAPGATATLELRLPAAFEGEVQVGDTIPAWWFDLEAGVWREEGEGMVLPASDGSGELAWVVEVSHFTWWNCDRPWTDKHCYDVTVVDPAGNPLPNVTVGADGVSYSGASWPDATDGEGQACVDIKLGSMANLFVGPANARLASRPVTGSGPAADCAGNGAACIPITIEVIPEVICTPGASMPCPYSGPADTLGVGLCQAAAKICNATGTAWSDCVGEVLPAQETCATPFDEDCDGETNEVEDGLDCECGLGDEPVTCYTGPDETEGIGTCRAGSRECIMEIGKYGACEGQVLPQGDLCSTPEDEDCDGTAMFEVWAGDFDTREQDLEQLRGCSSIEGSILLVISEGNAESLSALDSLEFVNGDLSLYTESALDKPVLPSLTTVGDHLEIENYGGPAADAFSSLVSVGGYVWMSGSVMEFPGLQTIGGYLGIDTYTRPESPINVFPSLVSVGEDVWLHGGVTGFSSLQTIGGYLEIGDYDCSGPLSAFTSLQNVQRIRLYEVYCGDLSAFNGISSLGGLDIERSEIGSLAGFEGLQTLVSLYIEGNSIGNVGGFQGLQSLGYLEINNSSVRMEGAFPALTSMGSFGSDNSTLHIIESFPVLEHITYHLQFQRSWWGSAASGEIVDSFNALDSIGGWFRIHDTSMSRIQGFEALTSVGRMDIRYNDALSVLDGFDRLAQAANGIYIYDNPALDACYVENLEATMRANGYTGWFSAFGNGPSGDACTAPP